MQNKIYTLDFIAQFLGGQIVGGDAELASTKEIVGLGTLQNAKTNQLSFLANSKYQSQLQGCKAGAVLISQEAVSSLNGFGILVKNPYFAFSKVSQLFDWRIKVESGISPHAHVSIESEIDDTAQVCAGAVVGRNVVIGKNVYIGPNTVIADNCAVGNNSRLEANVTLYPSVRVGEDCLIHSAAVIGADGFGFAPSEEGWKKIHQLGGVVIGNNVEIGAGTTVDRGAIEDTCIEDGVKLDNQVQIAHNVVVGENSAIAGCTAVAGSTTIGARSTIAGLSGITGHLDLAPETHVTAMTLVSKSVTKPRQIISSGTGQDLHQSWKKNVIRFKQLNNMSKRLTDIERKLESIVKEGH